MRLRGKKVRVKNAVRPVLIAGAVAVALKALPDFIRYVKIERM